MEKGQGSGPGFLSRIFLLSSKSSGHRAAASQSCNSNARTIVLRPLLTHCLHSDLASLPLAVFRDNPSEATVISPPSIRDLRSGFAPTWTSIHVRGNTMCSGGVICRITRATHPEGNSIITWRLGGVQHRGFARVIAVTAHDLVESPRSLAPPDQVGHAGTERGARLGSSAPATTAIVVLDTVTHYSRRSEFRSPSCLGYTCQPSRRC